MSAISTSNRRSIVGDIVAAISGEFQARRAARRLDRMDDRLLADIGVGRSEIDAAVRGRWPKSRRRA